LRYLRMNVVRWALPFLSAKRTAKNSTVKPIEYLSKLKFNCLYSAPHWAQLKRTRMETTNQTMTEKPKFTRFLIGGLIAGVISAVLNNLYSVVYTSITGHSVSEIINIGSITGASIIPTIVGALLYFGLSRFTTKATLVFIIAGSLLAIISCAGAFGSELADGTPTPEGFAGLTVPMHLFAGLIAIIVIPKYTYRK
ncbi:MAG: hypothetical protein HOG39_08305, partial [Candidatus Marinimicrobia bacterium]|nr:hypothetical protein [Candidatus Neomarinimicrobiota bacterium]MBT6417605.1 hypothetical protein [Candidatus Neomarinimicrobiota bacterium]